MKVVLSSRASRDLAEIARYIARDNPARAVTFVDELRTVTRKLGEMPQAFPLIPRYEAQGIRRRSYRGYGILYVARPERLFILRIIGPGQDSDRALGLA